MWTYCFRWLFLVAVPLTSLGQEAKINSLFLTFIGEPNNKDYFQSLNAHLKGALEENHGVCYESYHINIIRPQVDPTGKSSEEVRKEWRALLNAQMAEIDKEVSDTLSHSSAAYVMTIRQTIQQVFFGGAFSAKLKNGYAVFEVILFKRDSGERAWHYEFEKYGNKTNAKKAANLILRRLQQHKFLPR